MGASYRDYLETKKGYYARNPKIPPPRGAAHGKDKDRKQSVHTFFSKKGKFPTKAQLAQYRLL